MKKWTDVYKLKKKTGSSADPYQECEWICIEFAFPLDGEKGEELQCVIAPLQQHPLGKAFGKMPSPLGVYIISSKEVENFFECLEGRNYSEEQKEIEKSLIQEQNQEES